MGTLAEPAGQLHRHVMYNKVPVKVLEQIFTLLERKN